MLTGVLGYAMMKVYSGTPSSPWCIVIRLPTATTSSASGLADLQPSMPTAELHAFVLTRAQVGGATLFGVSGRSGRLSL